MYIVYIHNVIQFKITNLVIINHNFIEIKIKKYLFCITKYV